MDLYAYSQIDNLDEIAKAFGIDVPRLRGYRLMATEKPIDYMDMYNVVSLDTVEQLCRSRWNPGSCCFECSSYTSRLCKKYIKNFEHRHDIYRDDYDGPKPEINWDIIHGKKKKIVKTTIRNRMNEYKRQYAVWNKYCGRDDVLYIHARIGGNNWAYYDGPGMLSKPWFLEKVDDADDCTYCDIYAKIDPEKVKEINEQLHSDNSL